MGPRQGFSVYDAYGNQWLDFSSGVLITNAGHGHPRIVEAIRRQVDKPLLTTYCFPNGPRIELVQKLAALAPKPDYKVFLLSTGGESTESPLKLMRTFGLRHGSPAKSVIVSFVDAFHGRTMGAQQMGGSPTGKTWIRTSIRKLYRFLSRTGSAVKTPASGFSRPRWPRGTSIRATSPA